MDDHDNLPIDMAEQLRKQLESVDLTASLSTPTSSQQPFSENVQSGPYTPTIGSQKPELGSLSVNENISSVSLGGGLEGVNALNPQDPYAGMIHDENKTLDIVSILLKSLELDCSDVFIKADAPPMGKVLGKLQVLDATVLSDYAVEKLVQSLMNDKQAIKFAESQELDMSFNLSGKGRFRVSIYRQRGSIALVMRRIKSIVPTVDQLHLPRTLNDIVMQNRGLILITGATGSGKTSTLAAMLDYRNANSSGHILTTEDPIEFILSDKNCIVSQREVDVDTLSWDNALKGAMRQAPDVILIGEMRDLRSAKVSMDLAETGHLVLSTLHASNTMQTLERFIAIFPREMHEELYLRLSMSLVAIVCQRLVKTKDGAERYPALEIMISTPRIKDLIRKGEINAIKEVVASSRNMGMITFDQSIFDLWKQGIISEEEALNNADSPNNLQLMMKGISYAETG